MAARRSSAGAHPATTVAAAARLVPQDAPVSAGGAGAGCWNAGGTGARFGRGAYALLYLCCLLVYALVAWPHTHPPYMDSFYYVDIARNLAAGRA